MYSCFFFQAEDGIRDLVRSRGLGDVYKRQAQALTGISWRVPVEVLYWGYNDRGSQDIRERLFACLLYTSDAADDLLCVDLGGRRIIKNKKKKKTMHQHNKQQNNLA